VVVIDDARVNYEKKIFRLSLLLLFLSTFQYLSKTITILNVKQRLLPSLVCCATAIMPNSWKKHCPTLSRKQRAGGNRHHPSMHANASRKTCTLCSDGSGRSMGKTKGSHKGLRNNGPKFVEYCLIEYKQERSWQWDEL
jgi:hypothetical protein